MHYAARELLDRARVPLATALGDASARARTLLHCPPAQLPVGQWLDGVYETDQEHLAYRLFVQHGYRGRPVTLVVMLHGCAQGPEDFTAGTRMNEFAERDLFLVL